MKQAVILAGGKGTRLKERLSGLPKPLIDICGVPLLERQILLCKEFDFTHIIILVNHAAQHIIDFCASKKNWGLSISCIDDGEPRGTAGAVLAVLDHLADTFLVIYGDTMLSVDLNRFWNFHHQRQAAGSLFLHPNDHPHDSDLVIMNNDGNITAFHPYPHPAEAFEPNLVNAALYILNRPALEQWRESTTPLDFGKDLFPLMLKANQQLRGYNSPEYIKDCGTPKRLDKVCADYIKGRIVRSSLQHKQRAVFLDRDGTINEERNYVTKPEDFSLLPNVATGIRCLNDAEYRTVVVTNQPVIARGDCTVDTMRSIHNKMETLLGREGAYLDRIYYCPHHPDKGFPGEVVDLKIKCNCRKPNLGMIERAQIELNIDLSKSWIIGDTTVDVKMGKLSGLKTIQVETGHGGKDRRFDVLPDFVMPDLTSAVDFILDAYPKLRNWSDEFAKTVHARDIILIGGSARSGKTTLANVLALTLKEKGQDCIILSADRWLLSAEARTDTVLGRYDLSEIRRTLKNIVERRTYLELNLPRYDKLERKQILDAENVLIPLNAIVIFEGTIALYLKEDAPPETTHTLAVKINEGLRYERFVQEYKTRNFALDEINSLYISRQQDEIPFLDKLNERASICLTLPLE